MTSPVFAQKDYHYHIAGPAGVLQLVSRAAKEMPSAPKGVAVVCHPHPLYSGTMDNKVVTTLARAYRESGIHQIRFNFRGVGESGGKFGNLVGEIEDLLAVIKHLRSTCPDLPLFLGGFSFGSAVAANAAVQLKPRHLMLVAPPIGRYDLSFPEQFPCPISIVQGAQDELVDANVVRDWQSNLPTQVSYRQLDDAEHFFHGKITTIFNIFLEELSAPWPLESF